MERDEKSINEDLEGTGKQTEGMAVSLDGRPVDPAACRRCAAAVTSSLLFVIAHMIDEGGCDLIGVLERRLCWRKVTRAAFRSTQQAYSEAFSRTACMRIKVCCCSITLLICDSSSR